MFREPTVCPVCLNAHGATADFAKGPEGVRVGCSVCGGFITTTEAWDDWLDPERPQAAWWTPLRRAALSHALLTRSDVPIKFPPHPRYPEYPMITSPVLQALKAAGALLPSPPEQVRNILRIVGDHERETGAPLDRPAPDFYARAGCASPAAAERLAIEMNRQGLIRMLGEHTGEPVMLELSPTLAGWQLWEAQKQGRAASRRGVIAMKFGDAGLDAFVEGVIKPAVAQIDGFSLHRIDDPDTARAGVIDNIMRETIRDAAFLIADLTHANRGAYWEAGFAEGLGKPVIYLCERARWESEQTHFDTNHCTTLIWDPAEPDVFARRLVATLRNSLNLF